MSSESLVTSNNKKIGRVKWFNNKSGYGFITFMNNKENNKDIFVHHTSISSRQNLYKYLVQGEYVEFNVEKMTNKDHETQACDITGILGGDLMCETRFKNKETLAVKSKNVT